jgi:hypothetical protein
MTYLRAMIIGCVLAAACESDDKALSAPGPTATGVMTVGAAGAPPANLLPPIIGIAGRAADGAGNGGTQVALPNPFGTGESSTPGTGAAGSGAVSVSIGAAGSGF